MLVDDVDFERYQRNVAAAPDSPQPDEGHDFLLWEVADDYAMSAIRIVADGSYFGTISAAAPAFGCGAFVDASDSATPEDVEALLRATLPTVRGWCADPDNFPSRSTGPGTEASEEPVEQTSASGGGEQSLPQRGRPASVPTPCEWISPQEIAELFPGTNVTFPAPAQQLGADCIYTDETTGFRMHLQALLGANAGPGYLDAYREQLESAFESAGADVEFLDLPVFGDEAFAYNVGGGPDVTLRWLEGTADIELELTATQAGTTADVLEKAVEMARIIYTRS